MQISISIQAPEIASAILALAKAIEINTQGNLSAKNALATTITVLADVIEDSGKAAKAQAAATIEAAPAPEAEAPKAEKPEQPIDEEPKVSLEQVRAKLAALSQSGKQAEVKKLISEFGAHKLTEVPKERYAELLAKAEEL